MIAFLTGDVLEIASDSLVMNVQGVGYELFCSKQSLDYFEVEKGQAVQVFVHTHVREDILQLFGFSTKAEKQLFLALIKVNGIGPKVAIHALSGAPLKQIHQMIESEDVKALTQLPKIGRKTAEQIILALKGKLVMDERPVPVAVGVKRELTSALINLGFRGVDIERVLTKLPEEVSLDQGLRQALASLTSV